MDFLSLDSCNDTSDSLNFIIAKHLRDHFYYIAIEGKHNVYTEQDFIFLINKNNSTSSGYAIGLHPTDDVESYKTHIKIIKEKTNTPCIWFSYPLTSLLKETLGKEGFLDIGDLTGVCYLFQKKKISPTASANCELLTVTTHELFKAWCKINATVWNRSFESTYDFFRGISPSINTFSRVQLFLLKIDNTFVGSSALDIIGNVAGFYWDCILPSYRKRGFGNFMISERLKIAKESDCKYGIAQCLNTSLPLYLRQNFTAISKLAVFKYPGTSS